MNRYQEMAETFLNTARGILLKGEDLVPMTFLVSEDENEPLEICPMPFRTREEKAGMEHALRQFIEERKPDCVIRIADAWMNTIKPGDVPLEPRHDPDRQEAIIVTLKYGQMLEIWCQGHSGKGKDTVFGEIEKALAEPGKYTDYFWTPNEPTPFKTL